MNQSQNNAVEIVWLTPKNSSFYFKNGFLYIKTEGVDTRAILARQFPFDRLWEYISVLDPEQNEVGIIRTLEDFSGEDKKLLREELSRRYYSPVVKKILAMKERYGFSYWRVETSEGEMKFTMSDTFRNILHVGEHRLIFLDVDGNRFEIPDVTRLDKKSCKFIELYL